MKAILKLQKKVQCLAEKFEHGTSEISILRQEKEEAAQERKQMKEEISALRERVGTLEDRLGHIHQLSRI